MTQKELIRQEIERLKGVCMVQIKANTGQTFPFIMEMTGYDKLLTFIDSLPEEKPSEDLDEAAEEYADKHGFRVPYDGSINYYDDVDVKASKEGFLAGAEWMREKMKKEEVEGEIWEAINRYELEKKLNHEEGD